MTDESRTPSLVGLPAEVSTIIWDLLFAGTIVTLYGNGHAGGAVISSFENHTIPSVFLVCKRSYLETRPIFANAMTLDFKAFDSRKRADRIPAGTQAYYYQYIKRLRTFDSGCGGLDLRALTNLKHLIVTGTLCCFISRSGCDCHAQDEYMDGVYLWERRDKQLMQLVSNDAPEGRFGQALQSTLIDPERAYSVSLTVKLRGVVDLTFDADTGLLERREFNDYRKGEIVVWEAGKVSVYEAGTVGSPPIEEREWQPATDDTDQYWDCGHNFVFEACERTRFYFYEERGQRCSRTWE